MHKLKLSVLPVRLAICQLPPDSPIPNWVTRDRFYSITKTEDELSIITADHDIPAGVTCDPGWRALKVDSPLDFSLTGVLESVARPLAEASISIFAIATYNTDYILVKSTNLDRAITVLRTAGHTI